jgi:four helix bundle protein
MTRYRFEDLHVFHSATDLMVEVYRITETFPKREMYGLAGQLRRAAVSVVSNIAEGQGRLTYGEWRQLLSHGRGSLYEIEAQTIAALKLGFIDEDTYASVRKGARTVGGQLMGLIRYVQSKEAEVKSGRNADRRSPPTGHPADK